MSTARLPPPALAAITLGLAAVVGWAATRTVAPAARPTDPDTAPSEVDAGLAADAPAPPSTEPARLPERIDTLIVGGGPSPDANEIEIEASVELAAEVLGDARGVVLFAGGPGTRSVQVRDGEPEAGTLLTELAELFAPRNGRDARYQPTSLSAVHGAATEEELSRLLPLALFQPTEAPFTLVLIGHGSGGETPLESAFLLWGGAPLEAITLADLLAAPGAPAAVRRRVRVIATSCYAGGLAEIAFAGADAAMGPAPDDVCGFFATAWDLEAAGCDADPERGERDGYALHFMEALRGQGRDGSAIREEIDLDHDGIITLLEAHTRARIASRSVDVPTTTSNRLLRNLAPDDGPSVPVELPEETAVLTALGEALGEESTAGVETRLSDVEAAQGEAKGGLEELESAYDGEWTRLTNALLSRWPVIDDPFHPDFARMLADEGDDIRRFLDASDARAAMTSISEQLDALVASSDGLELEISLLRRWLEAHETLELASLLRARGGEGWARYERMRACESTPP